MDSEYQKQLLIQLLMNPQGANTQSPLMAAPYSTPMPNYSQPQNPAAPSPFPSPWSAPELPPPGYGVRYYR